MHTCAQPSFSCCCFLLSSPPPPQIPLTPLPSEYNSTFEAYIGDDIAPDIAKGIANGTVDPNTHTPFDFLTRPQYPTDAHTHAPTACAFTHMGGAPKSDGAHSYTAKKVDVQKRIES